MRRFALLVTIPMMACSARNCDNDALQSPFETQTGGEGGTPGVGGSPGVGGAVGGGGSGGTPTLPTDCDGDGVAEDLAIDRLHCGLCENSCGDDQGNDCVQGSCVAAQGPMPSGITVDPTFVYYWQDSDGPPAIHRAPLGGGPEELYVPVVPDEFQYDLVSHSGYLFGMLATQVVKVNTLMAPELYPVSTASLHFAKLAETVCWGSAAIITCNDPDGGGTLLVSLDAPPVGMTGNGEDLYWLDEFGNLYVASGGSSNGDHLATGFPAFLQAQIVVEGDMVYAVTDRSIWTTSAIYDSTGPYDATELVAIPELTDPGDIVFNGGWLYFTQAPRSDGQVGAVYRFKLENPDDVQVVYRTMQTGAAQYLAVAGDQVFFSVPADGVVMRHHIDAGTFANP